MIEKEETRRSGYGWPVMKIEDARQSANKTIIETTGAVYTVHHTNPGRIEAVQKINGPRKVFEMEFKASFEKMSLDYNDEAECTLYNPVECFGFNVRIFADSLLWVRAGKEVRVSTKGNWAPEYSYAEAGNMLLLDKEGGCGQYIITSKHPYGSVLYFPNPGITFNNDGWEVKFTLPATRKVLCCVAPPRQYNNAQSYGDRIVHHMFGKKSEDGTWNPMPSDEQIAEYSEVGNILTLHTWDALGAGPMKKNTDVKSRKDLYELHAYWAARRFEPQNEKELKRVINTARSCGMRVVPYLSPLFFPGTGREFLDELNRFLNDWPFDGLYYDGVSEDILEAYEIMKYTRKLIGPNGILYVHIPSPILGSSYAEGKYVYCPFIDTYADFILRAEHIDDFKDDVLRYTISAYNISNAIGMACNYDYSLDFNRKLISKVLDYNVRVPYWTAIDHYLKDRGEALGVEYPPEKDVHQIMREEYFPALNRRQKEL